MKAIIRVGMLFDMEGLNAFYLDGVSGTVDAALTVSRRSIGITRASSLVRLQS